MQSHSSVALKKSSCAGSKLTVQESEQLAVIAIVATIPRPKPPAITIPNGMIGKHDRKDEADSILLDVCRAKRQQRYDHDSL